jgi:uncharacterized protein involved in exopolysaccharide biosynthesis
LNVGQAERERDTAGYSRVPTRNPITARDILTPLFFFKRRAIIALLIPMVLGLFSALNAHPSFVAESRLLILLGDDYVFKNPLGAAVPGLTFDRSQIVHAETEIIASRELASETIQSVGLARIYPHAKGPLRFEYAAEQFQKDLGTENIPQSNVIKLTLRNSNREVAAEALNKLVAFYLERRRGIFEQNNQTNVDSQMKAIGQQLSSVEDQLRAFSVNHGFADYQQEFNSTLTQQIGLKNEIHTIEEQLAQRTGRISELEKAGVGTPPVTDISTDLVRSTQLDTLSQNLLSLQTQRRDAAAQYVDGSPIVADIDQRIAKLQAEIAKAPAQQVQGVRRGVNPARQDIDTQLRASQADASALQQGRQEAEAALDKADQRLAELVQLGPEYRNLMRQRALLEDGASALAKRSEEAKMAASLSRSQANVRVLQAATPPIDAHTGRPLLVMAGVVVGVIAAAATVVTSVALFQGMLTPNDLEQKLATPTVLAISNDPSAKPELAEGGLPSPMFMTPDDVKVLNHLLRSIAPREHCSLQIIGPTDGVGVSSILVDYALLAARDRQKVLVLDLEPRRGHSCAELLIHRGAVLHSTGQDGAVARVAGSNLYVTPPTRNQRQQLTMGERDWTKLLAQACKEYDLVLIDAPPLSRSWLGLFAAPSVDVTLAVIAAEETRAPVALNMIERVGGVGGVVAAAILNKRRFYIPKVVYNWL